MNTKKLLFLTSAALISVAAFADEVECTDGSVYVGKIESIDGGVISVETNTAGTVKVSQSEVVSITTDAPVFVRTPDKNTVRGRIVSESDGRVKIDGGSLAADLEISQIQTSWQDGALSPEEKLLSSKWAYSLGASMLGKTGNTESLTAGVSAEAVRTTSDDTLKFYANYNYGKTKETSGTKDWSKSADDLHCGVDYEHSISAMTFWYAREDLGFDRVKNIRFLSTSAAGLGYKVIDEDNWHFSLRGGLSYRYETYKDYMHDGNWDNPDDTSALGLDFGLHHDYSWDWGKIVTDISYTPAFEDFFGDYVATHESYVDFDVESIDNMSVRIGMKNEYRAETTAADHLDTTYYAKVIFVW
ncbi:MAG: DUF481 domain-containing protein [Opitutales bacterium]|nr:DUF481 domain-containing protein [Opitutales bacterium]